MNQPEITPLFTFHIFVWILCCAIVVGACASPSTTAARLSATPPVAESDLSTPTPERTTASPPVLITAVSDSPAAGICAGPAEGGITGVVIYPDIPDPRCLRITARQLLQVTNQTDTPLEIDLGSYHAVVEPGETYTFPTPFGEFLAPGVHLLHSSPYGGPELWLEN